MTLLFTDQDVLLFSPKLAERIGLNEAIVLQQIHYWITRETGGINHDGRKWIYNTLTQWRAQLPFMSESTIKRSMNTLKDLGFIDVQQLSTDGRDRTNYYTINQDKVSAEEAILLGSNRPMHQVNLTSSTGSNWSPPNRTETTTKTTPKKPRASLADDGGEHFKTFWSAYPKKAGKDAAKKAFAKRKFDEQAFEKVMAALNEQKASEQWQKDGGQFIPHPATWLNQGRFEDEISSAATPAPGSIGNFV